MGIESNRRFRGIGLLGILGGAQGVLYTILLLLSTRFLYGQGWSSRPILLVCLLLGVCFGLYLLTLSLIGRAAEDEADRPGFRRVETRGLVVIVAFAVLFRVLLVLSHPIQEIDYYRYLWDGRVLQSGVNPYRFSPAELEQAFARDGNGEGRLDRLEESLQESEALRTIFSRIHFREVPTVYPPLSQLVFFGVAVLTPKEASLALHVGMMKMAVTLFDLLTMVTLILILREIGWTRLWVAAYAWCPLVLKEFANSGHLDSIAVWLLTLTAWLLLREVRRVGTTSSAGLGSRRVWAAAGSSVAWGAAILAKLFPLVVAPLFIQWWWRRLNWRAVFPMLIAGTVVLAGYLPFFWGGGAPAGEGRSRPMAAEVSEPRGAQPAQDQDRQKDRQKPPDEGGPLIGLRTFLTQWEMNDLLFAVIYENLREPPVARAQPWFVVVPLEWREAWVRWIEAHWERSGFAEPGIDPAFLASRLALGGLWGLILVGLMTRRRCRENERLHLLSGLFLTLAWLWYLSPTQNPWYWIWAMPFVVFARSAWLLVSGLALLYYLRFWLDYQWGGNEVLGTPYSGTEFFDYVIVWVEHLPALLLVGLEAFRDRGDRALLSGGRHGDETGVD